MIRSLLVCFLTASIFSIQADAANELANDSRVQSPEATDRSLLESNPRSNLLGLRHSTKKKQKESSANPEIKPEPRTSNKPPNSHPTQPPKLGIGLATPNSNKALQSKSSPNCNGVPLYSKPDGYNAGPRFQNPQPYRPPGLNGQDSDLYYRQPSLRDQQNRSRHFDLGEPPWQSLELRKGSGQPMPRDIKPNLGPQKNQGYQMGRGIDDPSVAYPIAPDGTLVPKPGEKRFGPPQGPEQRLKPGSRYRKEATPAPYHDLGLPFKYPSGKILPMERQRPFGGSNSKGEGRPTPSKSKKTDF